MMNGHIRPWAYLERKIHSLHAEVLQATVSEGLAKGQYVVARAGFEPTNLRSKGIDSTQCATTVQSKTELKSDTVIVMKLL